MSGPRNAISEINKEKDRWTIVAKIIRLWSVPSMDRSNLPASMDMVLMDSRGDRIHATAKRTVIYKFRNILREGNVYCFHYFSVVDNTGNFKTSHHPFKVEFYLDTKINPVNMNAMPKSPFILVPIPQILAQGFDMSYLVDVMGMMTGYGEEKLVDVKGTMTKKNHMFLTDSNGCEIKCTLFGTYVDKLNSFLSSGETTIPVVVVQFASVKEWQNKITLQNAMYCTQVLFNPDFPEVADFKKRAVESNDTLSQGVSQISEYVKMTLEDDLLLNCVPKTVAELKSTKEATYVLPCAVLASITHIAEPESWWYQACKCNKSVYADSKLFFCEKCDKHVMNVTPRYRIRVGVVDHSGATTFVIFDRDAAELFGKTCREMIDKHENNKGDDSSLPSEIKALVDSTFLFKVDSNGGATSSRYEPSFKVKGLSPDLETIKKFGALAEKVNLSDSSVETCKTISTQKTVDLHEDSPASVSVCKSVVATSLSVAANLDREFETTQDKMIHNEMIQETTVASSVSQPIEGAQLNDLIPVDLTSTQDIVNDNEVIQETIGLSSQVEPVACEELNSVIDVDLTPSKRSSLEAFEESVRASTNGKLLKIIKKEKNA